MEGKCILLTFLKFLITWENLFREFVNKTIAAVLSRWPNCKMVNGTPRHSQTQGSIERCNQGNLLKGIDKNFFKTEGLGPFYLVFT